MIGFVQDDVPRDNEAIKTASGLWVAGKHAVPDVNAEEDGPAGSSSAVIQRTYWVDTNRRRPAPEFIV